MWGWAGKILKVDLGHGKISMEPLSKPFARAFLGGRGFNAKFLYEAKAWRVSSPYSPENFVVISPGGLVGASPSASRTIISSPRSPANSLFGSESIGSHWGSELKWAGYDMVILYGKASKPVYLQIEDGDVKIRDASHLKGKKVREVAEILREEVGDSKAKVLAVGPAGENLVASASLVSGFRRSTGGCGIGSVLGSKNLKAIIVRGSVGVKVAKPDELERAWEEAYHKLLESPLSKLWSAYGPTWLVKAFKENGSLPTYNWQQLPLTTPERIHFLLEKYWLKSVACTGCALHCDRYYLVWEEPFKGLRGAGIDYDFLSLFTSNMGDLKPREILYINSLLSELGLDAAQTANWISVMMHWWQDGLICEEDTDGLRFEWGNFEAVAETLRRIAYREGFGNLLAEGIFRFAEKLAERKGLPAEKLKRYIIHSRGLPILWEVRHEKGAALACFTSTFNPPSLNTELWLQCKTPEDFIGLPREVAEEFLKLKLQLPGRYEGKAAAAVFLEDCCAVYDALGVCRNHTAWAGQPLGLEELAKEFSAAMGIECGWMELKKAGERICNVERILLAKYGFDRMNDYPPPRLLEEKTPRGALLEKAKYDAMLEEYYERRGWGKNGIPAEGKLRELGLNELAEDLKGGR
ncbi:MAG: hypothetical protein DRO52_03415 [Candidatus Hecatellales archaeon]|nr:MAG: hypothetical protein DRO52_03415 [Candidatus Hecatellales archaeon]